MTSLSLFDFDLPPELIAEEPAEDRAQARLFCLSRSSGQLIHACVAQLPDLLREGDLLVVNNSRVFPARLLGRRVPSGGAVECLLIARLSEGGTSGASEERWEALVHPGLKLKPGAHVRFEGSPGVLHGEVLERRFYGRRVMRLWTGDGSPVERVVDLIGHVPLPPYIRRSDRPSDRERYQTVFAGPRGSVAAPTAGLHFSQDLLTRLSCRGVEIAEITLHVGYGTFQPVRVEEVERHRLDPERFAVSEAAADAVNRALTEGRRVIAVGTTTTRTLESVARAHAGRLVPGSGQTDLFIHPPFAFRVVGGLLTNFHLPRSSLIVLVSAFGGRERILDAYQQAIHARYRFYSYGDAMLIL